MKFKLIGRIKQYLIPAALANKWPLITSLVIAITGSFIFHQASNMFPDEGSVSDVQRKATQTLINQELHLTLILGYAMVMFFAVTQALRMNPDWKRWSWALYGGAVLASIGLHFLIPLNIDDFPIQHDFHPLDLMLYALVVHLLASTLPFWGKLRNHTFYFWRYNQGLLSQFFTASIYTGILFGGISLSALTFNLLIIKDAIPNEFYGYLSIWVFTVGHQLVFYMGIEEDSEQWESGNYHNNALKNLIRFILVPIIGLYLVILYLYGGKITFLWTLPKGIVSIMIMVFSVVGYLTVLLSHPFQGDDGGPMLKSLQKKFSWLLIPLMPLLFTALLVRLTQYGFTELRVALAYLDGWLLITTLYYAIYKKPNIIFLPVTLLALILVSRFIPAVNYHQLPVLSQEKRMINRFERLGMYNQENHTIQPFDSAAFFKSWKSPSTLPADSVLSKAGYTRETYFMDSISFEIYECLDYLVNEKHIQKLENSGFVLTKKALTEKQLNDYETRRIYIGQYIHKLNLPLITNKYERNFGDGNVPSYATQTEIEEIHESYTIKSPVIPTLLKPTNTQVMLSAEYYEDETYTLFYQGKKVTIYQTNSNINYFITVSIAGEADINIGRNEVDNLKLSAADFTTARDENGEISNTPSADEPTATEAMKPAIPLNSVYKGKQPIRIQKGNGKHLVTLYFMDMSIKMDEIANEKRLICAKNTKFLEQFYGVLELGTP